MMMSCERWSRRSGPHGKACGINAVGDDLHPPAGQTELGHVLSHASGNTNSGGGFVLEGPRRPAPPEWIPFAVLFDVQHDWDLRPERGLPAPNVLAVSVSDKDSRAEFCDQARELAEGPPFGPTIHPRHAQPGSIDL